MRYRAFGKYDALKSPHSHQISQKLAKSLEKTFAIMIKRF
jgi:hypothetical protein